MCGMVETVQRSGVVDADLVALATVRRRSIALKNEDFVLVSHYQMPKDLREG